MKFFFPMILWVLLASASFAEETTAPILQKGSRLIGGSVSFTSAGNSYFENSAGDRTQQWALRPGGGLFVADQLAFSLHLDGRWFTQGENWSSHYSMGPVLQYYFDTVGQDDAKGHALPYLSLGYLWGQAREDGVGFETKFNSKMWSVSAGLSWMLSDVVATDLELNYQIGQFTEKIPVDRISQDADRISFFLGFKAFLP